jgi:hypothetical protein
MLCGSGVVAIWNGITDAGRSDFYAWHLREHMPERVGIPGFRRGRRYRALDPATHPEFFTLYEVDSFEVLQGQDYATRLNAPTAWTKSATAHFRDTSRGLARVLASVGPGSGGCLATVRFLLGKDEFAKTSELADAMPTLARLPLVTGVHLCRADDEASRVKTAESRNRSDIEHPPSFFLLIEACAAQALEEVIRSVVTGFGMQDIRAGRYAHEYTRLKNDWTAG